jgi:CheY-like chemotaxis protein/DNA-binding XRE family transcriptional regulator
MAGKHTKYLGLMKAFGKAVRFYRNKLGFSQESLADRAQLDRSYMSQIERGIKNATLNSIWRISQALEVKASDLLALTEPLEAAGEATTAPRRQVGQPQKSGGTILVVDDDQDICMAVEGILRDAGFDTRIAGSGFDAIRVLAAEPVTCVVSDIRMPNGNGLELLDAVRRHHPNVPLYFITGYDDVTQEEAIRRGATGLFNKPFDTGSFVNSLRTKLRAPEIN